MAKTNKTPKAEDNAELRTISLLKILNTYSDENHELSTKNIMDKLQKECGVTVHRTTVGKNIKQLADCGFDIYTHKTTQNRYYLASRLFEMPELKLLADAVESAGFITEKKSEELIEKLCRLTSVYEAEALQEGFCANNGKSCNESIYYIADTINAAIANLAKREQKTRRLHVSASKIKQSALFCGILNGKQKGSGEHVCMVQKHSNACGGD